MTVPSDPVVPVNVTIRSWNPPDALAAKRGNGRAVCRVDENGTLADLRAVLTKDKAFDIDVNFVFIIDGRAVDKSSEVVATWKSALNVRVHVCLAFRDLISIIRRIRMWLSHVRPRKQLRYVQYTDPIPSCSTK